MGHLPFNDQCPSHMEISQLICLANHMTGFYITETLVVKWLREKEDKRLFAIN